MGHALIKVEKFDHLRIIKEHYGINELKYGIDFALWPDVGMSIVWDSLECTNFAKKGDDYDK